jgi:AcrR family transcriptional regulator
VTTTDFRTADTTHADTTHAGTTHAGTTSADAAPAAISPADLRAASVHPPVAPVAVGENGYPIAAAKQRILETANRLFYEEGIRAVGIDRLISESSVTKATFYKHYGSKDKLILEYLKVRSSLEHEFLASLQSAETNPTEVIRALMTAISDEVHRERFRGCPFLNAAAEFSDPLHPVRILVAEHRDWITDEYSLLLRSAGNPLPGDAADELMLARDGAMAGGYAGDPISASAALYRVVDRILGGAR